MLIPCLTAVAVIEATPLIDLETLAKTEGTHRDERPGNWPSEYCVLGGSDSHAARFIVFRWALLETVPLGNVFL
jgi:hypothetical protein